MLSEVEVQIKEQETIRGNTIPPTPFSRGKNKKD